jgi:hypothetical protein
MVTAADVMKAPFDDPGLGKTAACRHVSHQCYGKGRRQVQGLASRITHDNESVAKLMCKNAVPGPREETVPYAKYPIHESAKG